MYTLSISTERGNCFGPNYSTQPEENMLEARSKTTFHRILSHPVTSSEPKRFWPSNFFFFPFSNRAILSCRNPPLYTSVLSTLILLIQVSMLSAARRVANRSLVAPRPISLSVSRLTIASPLPLCSCIAIPPQSTSSLQARFNSSKVSGPVM